MVNWIIVSSVLAIASISALISTSADSVLDFTQADLVVDFFMELTLGIVVYGNIG